VNNFGAEGAGGTSGGTDMGNTGGDESAGSGKKKHGIVIASGAVTHNASASADGTTGSAASGAVGGTGNNTHAHGDGNGDGRTIMGCRKSNSGPSTTYKDPFCRALLIIYFKIYFCFQISSHKSDIADCVSPSKG
jgi:hypothetical protein